MEIKHITIAELEERIKRNTGSIKEGLTDLHFRLWAHTCTKGDVSPSYYATSVGAYCTHCNKLI